MPHFDLIALIETVGYAGLFAIIFAESGVLLGFFLPGDSLLFTTGFLASQGILSLPVLLIGCFIAAVLGDNFGYYFGKRFGGSIFNREDSMFFHKDHITRAQKFYEKHGAKTIALARFIPIVRTFAPVVAGVGKMDYKIFLTYNLIGGLIWAVGVQLAGYYLGKLIPDVDRYLLPIVALIVLSSIAPHILHFIRDPKHRADLLKEIKKLRKKVDKTNNN